MPVAKITFRPDTLKKLKKLAIDTETNLSAVVNHAVTSVYGDRTVPSAHSKKQTRAAK